MYDAFRHNNGSGDNVRTVRTCESLPLGAVYCTCSLSPIQTGWFVVCMAYTQPIEEDMHASPTGGQAARYDSNEPSGIPHTDPNHRAISWLFRSMSLACVHAAFSLISHESACNSRDSQSTKRQSCFRLKMISSIVSRPLQITREV